MTDLTARTDFRLTPEQCSQFERDGIIGPIKLYEPEEMDERWNVIRRQLPDRSCAIYPESGNGKVGVDHYDRHLDIDLLSSHIVNPRLVDPLISILGPDILCWRTEFFPKYAGDEGTDWHQVADFAVGTGTAEIEWPENVDGTRFGGAVTVWTAFTDSTLENGCLQVMPGTHNFMHYDESKVIDFDPTLINGVDKHGTKRGFYGYDFRDLQVDADWKPDESKAVPLVMSRGECVIFWTTLLHASLPHTGSKRDYRMGFAARFVPPFVRVYPNQTILNEHGAEAPLTKYRTVLVAGEDKVKINRVSSVSERGYKFVPRRIED